MSLNRYADMSLNRFFVIAKLSNGCLMQGVKPLFLGGRFPIFNFSYFLNFFDSSNFF